jgi:hypothetical protein
VLYKSQNLSPDKYVRFSHTDMDINGHWGITKEFDVSKKMWNIELLACNTDLEVQPIVQVASGNLLAYYKFLDGLTDNLILKSEVKRFKNGVECACCKKAIVFNVGTKSEDKTLEKSGLNYLRYEKCGHEIHASCRSKSCMCPICRDCK